jgi:hypothetical protein
VGPWLGLGKLRRQYSCLRSIGNISIPALIEEYNSFPAVRGFPKCHGPTTIACRSGGLVTRAGCSRYDVSSPYQHGWVLRVKEREPARVDLEKWLATTGYPLEMRVAKMLRDAGYSNVSISQRYVDPVEPGVLREIDVVGSVVKELGAGSKFVVRVVCECKHSRGNPWVNFTSPREIRFAEFLGLTLANRAGQRFLTKVFSSQESVPSSGTVPQEMGYHIVAFHPSEDERKKGRPNEPHAAVDAVIRASQTRASAIQSEPGELRVCEIVLPVVIVDGTLYVSRLGSRGLPKLKRTRATVILRDRLDSPGLSVPVQILTASAFGEWAAFCKSFWEGIVTGNHQAAVESINPAAT